MPPKKPEQMQSRDLSPKKVSESRTVMTEMIMPNDTNPMNNLMGGYLMRWMDIACAICAGRHCEAHVVTAAVDHISFQNPIRLGDVITLEARVTRAFNTAVDEDKRTPIRVAPVAPLSTEEQHLFESAARRRELRLILSGRIKPKEATEVRKFFAELDD